MRRSRRQLLLRIGVFALLLPAYCALVSSASAERAPGLNLKDLSGRSQRLSSLRGQIVVVNFWATWCGPCQEELPRLAHLAQTWGSKEIQFVAVSVDETKDQAAIPPLLTRLQVSPSANFAIWVGSSTYTLRTFGLGEVLPGTVVIDRDGSIVTHIMGEAKEEDIRSAVDWLLSGRSGAAPANVVKRY